MNRSNTPSLSFLTGVKSHFRHPGLSQASTQEQQIVYNSTGRSMSYSWRSCRTTQGISNLYWDPQYLLSWLVLLFRGQNKTKAEITNVKVNTPKTLPLKMAMGMDSFRFVLSGTERWTPTPASCRIWSSATLRVFNPHNIKFIVPDISVWYFQKKPMYRPFERRCSANVLRGCGSTDQENQNSILHCNHVMWNYTLNSPTAVTLQNTSPQEACFLRMPQVLFWVNPQ